MKLNTLEQKIISILEPLPIKNNRWEATGIFERSQIWINEAVMETWRSLRRQEPMNWDPWILKDGDVYRLFYLRGTPGCTPWWAISKICGAISTDMKHWQDLGTIIEPEPANYWESGRMCAGCIYKENDIYYLFYSASPREGIDYNTEAIGLATSVDGLHFSRYSNNYLLKPKDNDPWYGRCNGKDHFHWRDPYIFKDAKTGRYYMFICASARIPGNFPGCMGLAVADKITGPYNILPPAVKVPIERAEDWPYYHMERPQVIYREGKYHLFFSCFKYLMNPRWLKKVKEKRITNSSLYWYVSDKVEGPYAPVNEDDYIVRGSEKTGMYGTNFLQVSTQPEKFVAYGWYHRLHSLAVSQAFKVNWKNTSNPLDFSGDGGFHQQMELGSLEILLSKGD